MNNVEGKYFFYLVKLQSYSQLFCLLFWNEFFATFSRTNSYWFFSLFLVMYSNAAPFNASFAYIIFNTIVCLVYSFKFLISFNKIFVKLSTCYSGYSCPRNTCLTHTELATVSLAFNRPINRSSRQEVFCEKVFLKISQNSQENTWDRVSFLKKRLWHRCSPVNFAKLLRTPFFTEHLWWLLLNKLFIFRGAFRTLSTI